MKALSIKQPWAWLVVHGYQDVENRTWPLPKTFAVPQRIYVHAGLATDYSQEDGSLPHDIYHAMLNAHMSIEQYQRFRRWWGDVLGKWKEGVTTRQLPEFGAIVGEVTIVDILSVCGPNGLNDDRAESPWYDGDPYYGFVLADPIAYDEPISFRGGLGFFHVSDDYLDSKRRELIGQ